MPTNLSLGLGIGNGGVASSGPAAFPAPTGGIFIGPSLVQLGGGIETTSNYIDNREVNQGFGGTLFQAMNNRIKHAMGGMYGLTSSTSLALLGHLNSNTGRLQSAIISTPPNNPAGDANPAGTGNSADQGWSPKAAGNYTPLNHPANYVFLVGPCANDFGQAGYFTSATVSMQVMHQVFDLLHAAGKVIILLSETPRGKTTVINEKKTISAKQCTATNTTSFVDGESFDYPVSVTDNTTGAICTKVASGTTDYNGDQYTVNSSGVYTFGPQGTGTGSTPTKVRITYAYTSGGQATSAYTKTLQRWALSSDANFEGTGIAGALYGRSDYMISVDCHTAFADGSGNLKGGYSPDGIHFGHAMVNTIRTAVVSALTTRWGSNIPSPWKTLPTQSSLRVVRTGVGTTTITSGAGGVQPLSGRILSGLNGTTAASELKFFYVDADATMGTLQLMSVTDNGNGTGTITGSNVTSGTVTYATGAFTITFTSAPSNQTTIFATRDYANRIHNPFYEILNSVAGSKGGTNWTFTGGTIPTGYTISLDSAANGSDAAVGAGTLSVTGAQITDPTTGLGGLRFTISGVWGISSSGTSARITVGCGVSGNLMQILTRWTQGDPMISGALVRIKPGTNGHLYGLASVHVSNVVTISAKNFNASYTGPTSFGTRMNRGATTIPYTDMSLVGQSSLEEIIISAPMDTTGVTPSAMTADIQIQGLPGDGTDGQPVSAIIEITAPFVDQLSGEGPYAM